MKKSIELRQEKQGLVDQLETLTQKEVLTEEEETRADELIGKIHKLNTSIERAVNTEAIRQEKAAQIAEQRAEQKAATNQAPKKDEASDARKRFSFFRAIKLATSGKKMDGLEAEMTQEAKREALEAGCTDWRDSGFGVPSWFMDAKKRDVQVGTATDGGHTVATDLGELIEYLRPEMQAVRLGATVH